MTLFESWLKNVEAEDLLLISDEDDHREVAIINADSTRYIPSNAVDLVLTDPPFNVARKSNFHTYEKNTIHSYQVDEDKGWDTYTHGDFVDQLKAWSLEFHRVLRPGGSFAVFLRRFIHIPPH